MVMTMISKDKRGKNIYLGLRNSLFTNMLIHKQRDKSRFCDVIMMDAIRTSISGITSLITWEYTQGRSLMYVPTDSAEGSSHKKQIFLSIMSCTRRLKLYDV